MGHVYSVINLFWSSGFPSRLVTLEESYELRVLKWNLILHDVPLHTVSARRDLVKKLMLYNGLNTVELI